MMQTEMFRAARQPRRAEAGQPLIALSLKQPWLWAVLEAGKRLENRSQIDGGLPQVCSRRGSLWLHASKHESKRYWEESLEKMADAGLIRIPGTTNEVPEWPARAAVPRGAIVGRCMVVGHASAHVLPATARNGRERVEMWKHFGSRAQGVAERHVREVSSMLWLRRQSLWWERGYALILADVERLRTPVPCKGSQGLWRVPLDVAAQLEGAELIPCAA